MTSKFIELILLLLIVLIPLHMVMVDYLKILPGTWKEFLLVLAVVLWFVKGVMDRKLSIRKTRINLPLCLFIFWSIFLLLVDINNFQRNIIGLRNLLQYSLIFLLAINLIKDKSFIKKYVLLISIIGVAIATMVNYLYLFRIELFVHINRVISPTYPLLSTIRLTRMAPLAFMGAEHYTYYLSLVACLLFGFLLFVRSKLLKIMLVMGIGSMVLSMLLTYTRGGLLALFVAVLFFAFRYNRKLLLALIVVCLIASIFMPAGISRRFSFDGFFSKSREENSLWDRLEITRNVFLVSCTSPLWGMGLGNVGAAALVHDRLSTPHNYYLYLTLQTGFIGLLLYLWMLLIFFKTSISVFRRIEGGYLKGLMAGIIMFFIAFSVGGLFVGIGEGYITAPFFWLFGGFVIILDKQIPKISKSLLKNDGNN